MIQDAFWGILIPFLGTSLGAGCVFFLKNSLCDGIQTQGEPPCQRDAQIRHNEGKEAQHQEMSQSYSHAARIRPRTRGRGATR